MAPNAFHTYRGLIPAAYSPTTRTGEINLEAIPPLHALYRANGIDATFVCGTTGESVSLTTAERKTITAAWAQAADDDFRVLVHVGDNSQRDAIELASHAASVGAAGVAAFAPHYFKPASIEDLAAFFSPIAAAAPDLPFYYYDIPSLTGVSFATEKFLEIASDVIPNLAGVKYTRTDLMSMQACMQGSNGHFEVLFGCDEALLGGLSLGCRGAVGSTYNYAAPLYHRVIQAFDAGDLETARQWQHRSVQLVDVLVEFGVLRAGKAIMARLGVDCGPPRPPVRPLTATEIANLNTKLDAIGFDQWCMTQPMSSRSAAQ